MFEALLGVLQTGLNLWSDKEKTKYIDKLMELRKAYREEINKDPHLRSDAVLDNLEFELRNLGLAFSATAGSANTHDKP